MTTCDPPLKWAGGKRWLVPTLKPIYDTACADGPRRLVEPFCGGLSVTLGLQPALGLCNDICAPLINFYNWWQMGLRVAINDIDKDTYLRIRDEFNAVIASEQPNTPRAAWLFYILNKTGFNGLCRFNSAGGFNVPYGKRTKAAPLQASPEILGNVQFTCMPFEFLQLEPGDFVYADPPYDVQFTKYAKEDFTWDDQVRCAEWLAQHDGPVVLSNQATERIVTLYESLGYTIQYLNAPRRISCNGNRTPAKEVLACRNL